MAIATIPNSIGEQVLSRRLPHGLTLILNPRPDFSRTFGVLSTHYGSLDSVLTDPAGGAGTRVPDGIAHFLEHKLFEDQQGDVSLRFSARGASCNAGTEFTKTAYHFSCSELAEENLETLIRFVYDPWFTDESVAKEQGIIAQEIKMYDDDPDWVIFFNLLESMYHRHPVRVNIAGTVQSIQQITPDLLYRCHQKFYHPANMVLVVAGGFDATRLEEVADRTMESLPIGEGRSYKRPHMDEPPTILRRRHEQPFAVSRPQVALGFKDLEMPKDAQDYLRRDLVTRLMLDVLFSTSSRHHQRLYESGLIDDSFDASYAGEDDFGFTILGAETDDPDLLVAALFDILKRARKEGIPREDFELARNRFLGRYVRAFNSAESLAGALVTCHFRGVHLDDLIKTAAALKPEDLEKRLGSHLREEMSSISILRPNAEADEESADDDESPAA